MWQLLSLYFIQHSLHEVIQLTSTLHEQKFEFSDRLEVLLLELWETHEPKYIIEIAKEVIKQNLFNVEEHIFIVAILVDQGHLTIDESVPFLNSVKNYSYTESNKIIRNVIETTWLVAEDMREGFMAPGDDNILIDALKDVITLYKKRKFKSA
ncbi:MAG: hypothetical protein ABIH77_02020 [Pseudomonadota bacterium]